MKYLVLKWSDIDKYLDSDEQSELYRLIGRVSDGRTNDGKTPGNTYYVVNTDDYHVAPRVQYAFNCAGYDNTFNFDESPDGTLRLWYRTHLSYVKEGTSVVFVPIESVDHAIQVVKAMKAQMADDSNVLAFDYSLSVKRGEAWRPWCDEQGRFIRAVIGEEVD